MVVTLVASGDVKSTINQEEKLMASVTLKNVYKIYAGGVTAVTDFCLDIEDKEFWKKGISVIAEYAEKLKEWL